MVAFGGGGGALGGDDGAEDRVRFVEEGVVAVHVLEDEDAGTVEEHVVELGH